MITNDGKVYTYPKELPIGTEYANAFTEATVNNKKFNTVKAYVCCKIETALYYKKFMYANNGAKTVLPVLRHNNMWLKWNKLSTHREASIGFIKYVNTSITLQVSIRSRIELALCGMSLTEEDMKIIAPLTEGKKRKAPTDIHSEEFEPIQLSAFDLSTKKIGFGNGKIRVTTTAFEVKCHPDDAVILKRLFCRLSASDDKVPSNNHIHFVAYGLPQYTSSDLYRSQIIKQNTFLHNIAVIPIVNIESDVMYAGLYQKLLSQPSITGIEETHLTHTNGKWLIVTTKKTKEQAQRDIDSLISNSEIPTSIENPPGRTSKAHTHADYISYADMLQGDTLKYNEAMTGPPPSSNKRPATISYDLTDNTPPTPKKSRGKTPPTQNDSDSHHTEVTDFSSTTFLERLEANNKKVRKEIMIEMKQEIRQANQEILQKVEEMFTTFQTFMLNTQARANQEEFPITTLAQVSQMSPEKASLPPQSYHPSQSPYNPHYPTQSNTYSPAAIAQLNGWPGNYPSQQQQSQTMSILTQKSPNNIPPSST